MSGNTWIIYHRFVCIFGAMENYTGGIIQQLTVHIPSQNLASRLSLCKTPSLVYFPNRFLNHVKK